MGPNYQVEETFFQLNKEELSLRATMDLVGPSHQALHVQSSFDDSRLLTIRTERSEAMDNGEAPDGNNMEVGKTRQLFPTWRGVRLYEGLMVRLPSPENNSRCG